MAKSPTLMDRMKSFADKISGTSYIDNATNPNSAAYQTAHSILTSAQQKARANQPSLLPKQQVYGVPGISRNSQLPAKYQK